MLSESEIGTAQQRPGGEVGSSRASDLCHLVPVPQESQSKRGKSASLALLC